MSKEKSLGDLWYDLPYAGYSASSVGHCEREPGTHPACGDPRMSHTLALFRAMNAGRYLKLVGFLVFIYLKKNFQYILNLEVWNSPLFYTRYGRVAAVERLWTAQCFIALRIFCHPEGSTLSCWMFAAFLTCSWSGTLVWASVIWERIPSGWGVSGDEHFWGILSEAEGFPAMAQLCGALSIQQAQNGEDDTAHLNPQC